VCVFEWAFCSGLAAGRRQLVVIVITIIIIIIIIVVSMFGADIALVCGLGLIVLLLDQRLARGRQVGRVLLAGRKHNTWRRLMIGRQLIIIIINLCDSRWRIIIGQLRACQCASHRLHHQTARLAIRG